MMRIRAFRGGFRRLFSIQKNLFRNIGGVWT